MKLKKHCTCNSDQVGRHRLSCDLLYVEGKSYPRKKKRFFFFYPMKKV